MIGIDILENQRVAKMLENKNFLDKILTENEKKYVNQFADIIERVTGIFCAKEAVKKASGIAEKLSFLDFEILHKETGAPYVNFVNENFLHFNNKNFNLSISHSTTVSVAVCVINAMY